MELKNSIKLLYVLLTSAFLASADCYAQDTPIVSKGSLQFYLDHASFSGKDNKTYTEFYLMLFSDQLTVTNNSDTVKEIMINSIISDKSGNNVIADKTWYTSALLPRDSMNPVSMVVYDQWAELMNPGSYKVEVNLAIKNPPKAGRAVFSITVPAFNQDSFSVSQIEFVNQVQNDTGNSPFNKGNKKIIPNPWRRYGALNSRLTFYYELYNMPLEGITGEYVIKDKNGSAVKKLTDIKFSDSSDNICMVHGINVSSLTTGTYQLNIILNDKSNHSLENQTGLFEIIQMDKVVTGSKLTEDEAEIEGALIKYTGTPKEYDMYENLDLTGKSQFIVNFWSEKDPTPGTPENEYLQKVRQRFLYASQNFKWGKTPGWKSDRGKILIKYGMPDETEPHSSEAGTKNYEIWKYNKDKTFIFVFVDLRSNGNYTLVHSTKEGEISDPNWTEYLK